MLLPENEPEIKYFPGFLLMTGGYDAWRMLFEIFGQYKLDEIREFLWDMHKAAMKDETMYDTRKERSDLMFFFERLNDLATAAYVVARKKWAKTPKYHESEEDTESAKIFRQRIKEFEAEQKSLKDGI